MGIYFSSKGILSQKRQQISRKSISLPDGGSLVLPIGEIVKTGARSFQIWYLKQKRALHEVLHQFQQNDRNPGMDKSRAFFYQLSIPLLEFYLVKKLLC